MKTENNNKQEITKDKDDIKINNNKILMWIILGVIGLLLVAAAIVILIILQNKQHDEAVTKYAQAWFDYSEAQENFGYEFGVILGEMEYTTDGSGKYNLNYEDQYEISKLCAKKVGVYDEIYNNPYSVKDNNISEKDTAEIIKAANKLTEYTDKINDAKNSVSDCEEIGENKKKEIDSKNAEKEAGERAKADEEAAKKKQEEEDRIAREKYSLSYSKFINQIHEGMTLSAIKEVYGGFDDQCKVGSQSSGYVIYSCTSSSTYDNWAASFSFYNGILQNKAQSGLK